MLKKILDPKSGKEEYMDTGAGGMSGQNSRDFHAVARDKFFSFSKFHKVAEICFSCGRHLSEKEISSCYEKNIVFVCYKCRKKFQLVSNIIYYISKYPEQDTIIIKIECNNKYNAHNKIY